MNAIDPQLQPIGERVAPTQKRLVEWLRKRLTVTTDAAQRGEEVSGSAKRHGKRSVLLFGLKWTWLLVLLTGCTYYRQTAQSVTVLDVGTGKRTFAAPGVAISHSEIAATLKAAEGLAGKVAEGAARGAVKGTM